MHKDLSLHAIIMRKKLKYVKGTKSKMFANLLKRNFSVEGTTKYGVPALPITD